jgi:ligand-binding sensor domain-containing protein
MALGVAVAVSACTSTPTTPAPPALPPQITVLASYTNTHDNKGLPSNDVYAFLTLSNGEFWVGTAAGIARYPDATATTHAPDKIVNEITGLPHPQVRSMVELDGKVFVGTWGGGIGIYDIAGDAWTQVRPGTTGLTDGYVAELATSPTEDKVYLATNDGAFIYKPSTNGWEHFSTVDPNLNQNDPHYTENVRLQSAASSLEVTENLGIVQRWYGPRVEIHVENNRLSLFGITVSKNTSEVYKYSPVSSGLVEPNVNDIYYDAVRQTYFVSYVSKGISEVNLTDKTWTSSTLVQGLPSNTVYGITRAGDGKGGTTLWAATQGGLAKLGVTHWEAFGRSGGLPADRVRRVYSDDGKRLWVGFIEGGAVRVKV